MKLIIETEIQKAIQACCENGQMRPTVLRAKYVDNKKAAPTPPEKESTVSQPAHADEITNVAQSVVVNIPAEENEGIQQYAIDREEGGKMETNSKNEATQQNATDKEEGWKTKTNRKRIQQTTQYECKLRTETTEKRIIIKETKKVHRIKAAERKGWAYVGKLHPSTREDDLEAYLKDNGIEDVNCK